MSIRILQGDCREVLKTLPDCSVDSIVTDPPYHLTTGKKGGTGEASASEYMAYMRARGALDSLKIETLSAGQRGFLASAAKPMTGGVVTA